MFYTSGMIWAASKKSLNWAVILAIFLPLALCSSLEAKGEIKDGFFLVHKPAIFYGPGTYFQSLVFFEDQKRDGVDISYLKDGDVQQLLHYERNRLNGSCVGFYDNGNMAYRLSYRQGLRHGQAHYYYEDGQLRAVIHYYYGRPDGTAKFYNRNGILKKMALFDRGRLAQVK